MLIINILIAVFIFVFLYLWLSYYESRKYIVKEINNKMYDLWNSESYKKLKKITKNPVGEFLPNCSYFKSGKVSGYEDKEIKEKEIPMVHIEKIKPFILKDFLSTKYKLNKDQKEDIFITSIYISIWVFILLTLNIMNINFAESVFISLMSLFMLLYLKVRMGSIVFIGILFSLITYGLIKLIGWIL